ncbi:MAG: AbrB/MazE/SpoVT family DNA-binding domain-containing protein [Nanoarchaeota archaeon]|nr:AbrB/MazE/SpoVT family DNA-binding domain-containing protein [Nanoarchaeota archaeon]
MSELVKMSSKGQIVVPKELREELNLETGTSFVIFGKEDTLVLKKVDLPSAKEAFERIHKWGTKLAKEKGWKQGDVMKIIHKGRGVRSG